MPTNQGPITDALVSQDKRILLKCETSCTCVRGSIIAAVVPYVSFGASVTREKHA